MSALQRAVASATNIGIPCMGQFVGAKEISVDESKLAGVSSFFCCFASVVVSWCCVLMCVVIVYCSSGANRR
jgi:hypothetical protein